jgi:hypothetical protein
MTGKTALIGHTGFVGSFLKSASPYTHFYNSTNIEAIRGEQFDVIVCAGASAAKWRANAEPEIDRQGIQRLTDALTDVHAERFILISTIDVFQSPLQVDENTQIDTKNLHPYGAHRYSLENFVRGHFAQSRILRLPALFGPGLKKNALYDLFNDNGLDQIPMDGIFQWYNLQRLPQDMRRAEGLPLAHLATEPVSMQTIVERLFPEKINTGRRGSAPHYNMRTIYAEKFGGANGYIANAESVLTDMELYVQGERQRTKRRA